MIDEIMKEMNINKEDVQKAIDYFKTFKYLKDNFNLGDLFNAVKRFQEYFHLSQDGILGPKTLRAMSNQRCGCSEKLIESATLAKWNRNKITYSVHGFVDGLPKELQEEIYIRAWESIEAVCNLTIYYVGRDKPADINIKVSGRGNGLGSPQGTLAYAYLPNGNDQPLDLVMDLAETWIDYPQQRGILMQNVAAHELCHNMGLSHTSVPSSLMNPYYNPSIATPQKNDINQLQSRYGPPSRKPNDPPDSPNNPENPPSKTTVEITGNVVSISIPGYRVIKV